MIGVMIDRARETSWSCVQGMTLGPDTAVLLRQIVLHITAVHSCSDCGLLWPFRLRNSNMCLLGPVINTGISQQTYKETVCLLRGIKPSF